MKLNTDWLQQARAGQVNAASASSAGCSTVSISLANGKDITTSLTMTSAPAASSDTAGAASAARSEGDNTALTWTGSVAGEDHDSLVSLAAATAGDSTDPVWAGTIRSSKHGVHTLLADPANPNTYIMLQLDESKIKGSMLLPTEELPGITASNMISTSGDSNTGRKLLQQEPNSADLDPYGEQAASNASTARFFPLQLMAA